MKPKVDFGPVSLARNVIKVGPDLSAKTNVVAVLVTLAMAMASATKGQMATGPALAASTSLRATGEELTVEPVQQITLELIANVHALVATTASLVVVAVFAKLMRMEMVCALATLAGPLILGVLIATLLIMDKAAGRHAMGSSG